MNDYDKTEKGVALTWSVARGSFWASRSSFSGIYNGIVCKEWKVGVVMDDWPTDPMRVSSVNLTFWKSDGFHYCQQTNRICPVIKLKPRRKNICGSWKWFGF